ncbi:Metal-dependent hydrolase, endonuclease/exonuclease/phosphatase family [Actinacidiphila yanglinensis]|uniref:Metal-dependent hydrolase, endonuclease/exonuclease/phosphatase family n=1 Tax=Actinacidiphila yanglinensis TaxID=310779 RepID=A0A1H6DZE7_9ACTN|nr:endonuclease/exonuclease/phosphatase family protein [Actinacidiphila yanglinensis]SEG90203.1 Metal-dependent hydrolase, endonuclease/exonuclease/phosphatase family [Actinacidiphila yanglinensis]
MVSGGSGETGESGADDGVAASSAGGADGDATAGTARDSGALSVMTWNLWWRFGGWRERREAILRTLEAERPDILGLQEVWADNGPGGENLARWLAERLDMHWTWSPAVVQDRWHSRNGGDTTVDVGVAVLSRHPILETAERRLPTLPGHRDDGKTALHALLDVPGGPLPFFTTHLNSGIAESAVRCAQVRELAAFVAEHAHGPYPPVVTGDFNAESDFDEVRLICGYKTAPAVPGLVLLDAWRFADPALPQGTWDIAHEEAVNFGMRPSCIDYILVGLPGPDSRGWIRTARRSGDRRVAGVWPSDHAAVRAELALPDPALKLSGA